MLALFLFALTLPIYFLLSRVYRQLENETLYQYRGQAEDVVRNISAKLQSVLSPEESRSFDEYSFFNVGNVPLQRGQGLTYSPLAEFPPKTALPGIVGYFQVNPDGTLQTPLLPKLENGVAPGLEGEELAKRLAAWDQLYRVLVEEQSLPPSPSPPPSSAPSTPAEGKVGASGDEVVAKAEAPKKEVARSEMTEKEISEIVVENRIAQQQLEPDRLLKEEGRFAGAPQVADLNLDAKYLDGGAGRAAATASKGAPNVGASAQNVRARRKEKVAIPVSAEQLPSEIASERAPFRVPPPPARQEIRETDLAVPGGSSPSAAAAVGQPEKKSPPAIRVLTLEGEVDPFQFRVLDNLHLLFLRKVWRGGSRYLQGFVLRGAPFFEDMFVTPFRRSSLSDTATLIIGYKGVFFQRIAPPGAPASKEKALVLYRTQLEAPFDQLELLITAPELPIGPGAQVVNALAYALLAVLFGGLYGIYRIGLRQIVLAKERSDFVSAVSHELKTPLTSIRMYSEMLRSGWVEDEQKKRSYYDYIFTESERLSRLIANVLQFARLSHSNAELEKKSVPVEELLPLADSKVRSQVEQAGFTLALEVLDRRPAAGRSSLIVDIEEDGFARIAINLVDNALKFSAKCEDKQILLSVRIDSDHVLFCVRDFGPGVPREEMKKIFRLFYRAEDEMNRSTPGTGIGLALVSELAAKMGGTVDLKNHQPGAEFLVRLPARSAEE